MLKKTFAHLMVILGSLILANCSSTSNIGMPSFGQSDQPSRQLSTQELLTDNTIWQSSPNTVWNNVSHVSLTKLEAASNVSDTIASGWIKLAIIAKRYSLDTKELAQQLMAWRSQFSNHPGNSIFPDNSNLTTLLNTPLPQHIALLLPLQNRAGQAIRDGFLSAYYDSLAKNHVQQTISFYDTSVNKNIPALYQQAVAEGATFVVGPLMKDEVQTLTNAGGFKVPTLELNYTEIGFGSLPNNLYQFGLSQTDETQQVADKAKSAGHSRALIIVSKSDATMRSAKSLISRWQADGGTIVDSLYFDPKTNLTQSVADLLHVNPTADTKRSRSKDSNKTTLEQQRRQDFDVIFLLTDPQSAREVVPLLKFYYASNVPIYATSSVYSGAPNPAKDQDLNGVIFCDIPWLIQAKNANRLTAVGHDAYLLSSDLPRLRMMPNFPMYTATGALSLNSHQQIYRRLPWTKMHGGMP